jgi:hypothetical protein
VPFLGSRREEVGRFMLDMHRKKSVQVLLSTSKFIIIRCENDDHPPQINPGLCVFTIYWWKINYLSGMG